MKLSTDPNVLRSEIASLERKRKSDANGKYQSYTVAISHRKRALARLGTDDALDAQVAAQAHSESAAPPPKLTTGRIPIRSGARTILMGTFGCPAGVTATEVLQIEDTLNGNEVVDARVFVDFD